MFGKKPPVNKVSGCFRGSRSLIDWSRSYAVFIAPVAVVGAVVVYAMNHIGLGAWILGADDDEEENGRNTTNAENSKGVSRRKKSNSNYRGSRNSSGGNKRQSESFTNVSQAVIENINHLRARHGVPALQTSIGLSKVAQNSAKSFASFENWEELTNDAYGTNLWVHKGGGTLSSAVICCHDWYAERELYEYGMEFPGSSPNFTQMMWKESWAVGVGSVKKHEKFVVVAKFHPAGNISGQFSANVPPPIK